jgi:dihydroorotate dehydrogenase (NAD+) catalytic subunit
MKIDLSLSKPLMNAAGSLGFAPEARGAVDLSPLGAFITNPISPGERSPARGVRYLPFPGGFLLHTGYPNPGLKTAIRHYAARWRRSPLPVLIHLLPGSPQETAQMVQALETVEGIAGLEVSLPLNADGASVLAFSQAARGELPVVLRLPLEGATRLAPHLASTGLAGISLAPPRGTLPLPDGGFVQGRLYGPALFPLALAVVQALARWDIPVIAAGGVYQPEQAEALLRAGAAAVQLDSVLWQGGFELKS